MIVPAAGDRRRGTLNLWFLFSGPLVVGPVELVGERVAHAIAVTPVTALCVDIHYETLTEWPPSTG